MNSSENLELRNFLSDVDSVHLMPCKKGLFSKSLGKILPDQLVGQVTNNYQQINYYGYDLSEVLGKVSELLNEMQSKQDEIQYQNFIKNLKRFRTSGKNIDQLFENSAEISTVYINNLVSLDLNNFRDNNTRENSLLLCERLVFILFIYLFSSVLIEGSNIKKDEEVRDDINKILIHLQNIYESLLYNENRSSEDRFNRNPPSISESLYAHILTDEFCETSFINKFAEVDSRFENGYEVIDKIIKDRWFNKSNIVNNSRGRNEIKLEISNMTWENNNKTRCWTNEFILIDRLNGVISDLIQLKSIRDSFNEIDDFGLDEYKANLLRIDYKA